MYKQQSKLLRFFAKKPPVRAPANVADTNGIALDRSATSDELPVDCQSKAKEQSQRKRSTDADLPGQPARQKRPAEASSERDRKEKIKRKLDGADGGEQSYR